MKSGGYAFKDSIGLQSSTVVSFGSRVKLLSSRGVRFTESQRKRLKRPILVVLRRVVSVKRPFTTQTF